jgi:hypothetical protein
MGGFRAVEDRPTPKEVYNWRLYFEASVIAMGSLLYVAVRLSSGISLLSNDAYSFGYDSAFIGTTIARASFKRDFGITPANAASISSDITSAFQAGALGGAIICFLSELNRYNA